MPPSMTPLLSLFFFLIIRRPPRSTLFPSTPLSRSPRAGNPAERAQARLGKRGVPPIARADHAQPAAERSEEHTSELQSPCNLVCRLLLEKKKIDQKSVLQ